MRTSHISIAIGIVLVLAGCASGGDGIPAPTSTAPAPPTNVDPTTTTTVSAPDQFPVEVFAAIGEEPVSDELAARFQAALEGFAGSDVFDEGGGMVATVMTADGAWSGTVGTADGVRDLQVDDQFAIASITKSVVAAQVMSMVEEGELGLDDPVADHLPPDFDFDTTGMTIRHLLSHRSGLPNYEDLLYDRLQADFQRVWTPVEILEMIPTVRTPPGGTMEYAETNYLVLRLVIEHLRGRPLAEVLRDDVLAIPGVERMILQPGESPSEPIAMPAGQPAATLELRGGYIPSLADVTAFSGSGAMASDSPSLARWWRAFCSGEIVSQATLTEMSAFDTDVSSFDGAYGLGLFNPVYPHAQAAGHQGWLEGYFSWAACLPEEGAVIVLLTNRPVPEMTIELFYGALRPLVEVVRSS